MLKLSFYEVIFYSLLVIFLFMSEKIYSQLPGGASGLITYYDIYYAQQRPVVNVRIRIETFNPPMTYNIYTDANGGFSIDFPEGNYPDQATARLFFENSKIDIRGVSTTRSAFVSEVNIGILGPCPPEPWPCTYELGYFQNLSIDFINGGFNNNCANIFKYVNLAADFSITNGYTPPKCIIKYPAEKSIINNHHVSSSSFYWPFRTYNSDELSYIVGSIFPFIGIAYFMCDCEAELTQHAVYLEENLIQTNYRSTIFHEYGHFLMHSARGWNWPVSLNEYINGDVPYQHSWGDIEQHERLAFLEGWANFFGSAVESWLINPSWPYSGIYRTQGENLPPNFFENPGYPYTTRPNGFKHEVLVGSAFFDFYDPANGDDAFQTSFVNILNVIADRKSVMTDYIATLARKPFLADAQRNAGIGVMNLNRMEPLIPYGNVNLKVKNDFDAGIVNIDGSNLNTSQQPTPGIVEQTQLWMSSKRLQAIEQPYGNYQRLFRHTNSINPTDTWTTGDPFTKNFTDIWNAYSDQLTYRANFDKLCDVAVNYISYDGVTMPGSFSGSYRSGKNLLLSAPDHIINGVTHKFIGWSDGSTQNPRDILVNEHVNLIGYYKGHMISSVSSATGPNNQRKILANNGNDYWITYESNGRIWELGKQNGYICPEMLVSNIPGISLTPSLTESNYNTSGLHYIWHNINDGKNKIYTWRDNECKEVTDIQVHQEISPTPVIALKHSVVGDMNDFRPVSYIITAWTHSGGIDTATSKKELIGGWDTVWKKGLFVADRYRPSVFAGPLKNTNTHLVNVVYYSYDDSRGVYWRKRYTNPYENWKKDEEPKGPVKLYDITTNEQLILSSYSPYVRFSGKSQIAGSDSDAAVVWEMQEEAPMKNSEPVLEEINGELIEKSIIPIQQCFNPPSIGFSRPERSSIISTKFTGCDFKSPTVTVLDGGKILMAWTDDLKLWEARSTDGGNRWNVIRKDDEGKFPNLSISADILSNDANYVFTKGTSSPFEIGLRTNDLNEQYSESDAREIAVVDKESEAGISIEMPELYYTTSSEAVRKISFSLVSDSGYNIKNIESYLSTEEFTVPQDAESLFIPISMKSKNANALTSSKNKLKVRFRFIPNYGTSQYTAGVWRFENDHYFNKTIRIPAERLRGRKLRLDVSIIGLSRSRPNIIASASAAYYPDFTNQSNAKIAALSNNTNNLPSKYSLEQNYPNPFNPTTVIKYQLPVDGYVTLKIYDVLGREVATLVDEHKSAGYYDVSLDARTLTSGVYFYKLVVSSTESLSAGSYTSVKKLLLLR